MSVLDLKNEELDVWRENRYSVKKIIVQLIAERETNRKLHETLRSKMPKINGGSYMDSIMIALVDIEKESQA